MIFMISAVQCSQSVCQCDLYLSLSLVSTLSWSEVSLSEENVYRRLCPLLLPTVLCSLERLEDWPQVLPGEFDHLLGLWGVTSPRAHTLFIIVLFRVVSLWFCHFLTRVRLSATCTSFS